MITFVLRVAAGRDGLRGTATHVASGETCAFAGQAELWTFLEQRVVVDGIGALSAEWVHEAEEPDPDLRAGADCPPPAPGIQ
jgi:hypothetical protein